MTAPEVYFAPMAPEHLQLLSAFDCGPEDWALELKDFLVNDALREQAERLSKTYLFLRLGQRAECLAFVTLLAGDVRRGDWSLSGLIRSEKVAYDSVPAVLIGRFAVSSTEQGSGLGAYIMAWIRTIVTDLDVGVRVLALHVDKRNERGLSFYRREGFREARIAPSRRMQLMLADLLVESA